MKLSTVIGIVVILLALALLIHLSYELSPGEVLEAERLFIGH